MQSLSPTFPRVHPSPQVRARRFDKELVLIDLSCGEYYALNEIGAWLWEQVSQGGTLESLAARLVAAYPAHKEEIVQDLHELIGTFLSKKLFVAGQKGSLCLPAAD